MIKIPVFLTTVFVIGLFSANAYSQCPTGIGPYSSGLSSVDGIVDFELARNKGGINDLAFKSDGSLRYLGGKFKPAVTVARGIKKFIVYQNSQADSAIAIPKSGSSKAVTTFYTLNTDNCTSRKVTISSLTLDKVVWISTNKSVAFLREANGNRFAQVNAKTGKTTIGKKSRNNNPCEKYKDNS